MRMRSSWLLQSRFEQALSLRVVGRDIADQHQGGVNLLSGDAKGIDDALRVLPFVEARDLRDDRQVGRDAVVLQPLYDLLFRQVLVGGRKGVDRRHDEALRDGDVAGIFGKRDHHGVIVLDEAAQIGPQLLVWTRKVHMAAPDPRRSLAKVGDDRQGLRVVDDHQIMVKMHANGVLEHHLFINVPLHVGEKELVALQGVVHPLGDVEEVGPALNDAPSGGNAGCVHEQGERGQEFRHAAAIVGGVDIDDVHAAQARCLGEDALHRGITDEGAVVLQRRDLQGRGRV